MKLKINKDPDDHKNQKQNEEDARRIKELIEMNESGKVDDTKNVLEFLSADPKKFNDSIIDITDPANITEIEEPKSTVKLNIGQTNKGQGQVLNINKPEVKEPPSFKIDKLNEANNKKSNPNKNIKISVNKEPETKPVEETSQKPVSIKIENATKPEVKEERKDIFDDIQINYGDETAATLNIKKDINPPIDLQKEETEVKQEPKKRKWFGFGGKSKSEKSEKKPKKEKVAKPKKEKAPKNNKNKDKKTINSNEKITKEGKDKVEDDLLTKQYNKLKMKRVMTTGLILTFVGSMVVFGTYNTFLKPEKDSRQIASEVNTINMTTPFPEAGVEAFIKQNLEDLYKDNIRKANDVQEVSIVKDSVEITSVVKKTASIANVYFTASIKTDRGANPHNFVLPVNYDYNGGSYNPAGALQVTPVKPKNTVTVSENPVLSFEGIDKIPDEKAKPVATFVENFLMMMYNENADISPYYKGKEVLGDPNTKFVRMVSFEYYKDKNQNHFNAIVEYVIMFNEGAEYTVKSYLDIDPSGEKSYIINNII